MIIGAVLIDGKNPPLQHSVVVIQNGTVVASGSQQTVPIPPGSEKINAAGKFLMSEQPGGLIVPGSAADLLLLTQDKRVERRMVKGNWVKPL